MGSLSLLLGNLPNPGIEPSSPTLRADSLPTELKLCDLGCVCSCFIHVPLFVTLWTVARQAPLSMGLSRQVASILCVIVTYKQGGGEDSTLYHNNF